MTQVRFSFQKSDTSKLVYECNVSDKENLVSLREKIIPNFSSGVQIDAKKVVFKLNDIVLDLNESLVKLIDDKATIDCTIDENINTKLLFILHVKRNNSKIPLVSIEIEDTQTISDLKNLINNLTGFDVLHFYKDKELSDEGNLFENKILDNDSIIAIIQEDGKLLLYSILEEGEPIYIDYSNDEEIDCIKQRIADNLRSTVDEFILFYLDDIMDEKKYVYQYYILTRSVVKYCFFNKISEVKPLGDKIANGEYSVVYKAEIVKTRAIITLKKYNWKAISMNLDSYKLLIRELISFNRLDSHCRIVRLKAFYKDNEALYIGMDYMARGSIFTYLSEYWPLHEHLIAKWAKQILEGLAYLHSKSVIHNDLKTSNILLDENEDIKISGFSYSKYFMGANSSVMCAFESNSKPPTMIYSAPERINEEKFGSKSDIWSFGAILVEIVTGKRPYSKMHEVDAVLLIARARKIEYDIPKQGISKELKNFIDLCLNSIPKDRPKAAALLKEKFLMLYTSELVMERNNN